MSIGLHVHNASRLFLPRVLDWKAVQYYALSGSNCMRALSHRYRVVRLQSMRIRSISFSLKLAGFHQLAPSIRFSCSKKTIEKEIGTGLNSIHWEIKYIRDFSNRRCVWLQLSQSSLTPINSLIAHSLLSGEFSRATLLGHNRSLFRSVLAVLVCYRFDCFPNASLKCFSVRHASYQKTWAHSNVDKNINDRFVDRI